MPEYNFNEEPLLNSNTTIELEATAPIESMTIPKHWKRPPVDWISGSFIVAMHIACIGAFFTFSWQALLLCIVLHWITGGIGVTLTYHRLLTHRSFTIPKWLEYFLSAVASLACQGGPLTWVATHRLHHAASDAAADPHSPRHGFFWSHMGWCLREVPAVHRLEGKAQWAPDLAKDPVHRFLDRAQILWTILLAIALYMWGGWSFVIWGICVRLVAVYHSTWFVNSAAHVWGYKTYSSGDDSKNLWWVALLTYGEGWHNNHHAFQTSARHGLKWWEFDTTYLTIQCLKFFGLAKNIKVPSSHQLSTKQAA